MKPKTTTAVTNLYAKKERKKKQTRLNLVPLKPASKLFQRYGRKEEKRKKQRSKQVSKKVGQNTDPLNTRPYRSQ